MNVKNSEHVIHSDYIKSLFGEMSSKASVGRKINKDQ